MLVIAREVGHGFPSEGRAAVSFADLRGDDRLEAMRREIDAAVESMGTAAGWTAFLEWRRRFHRYSLSNQLLVAMQRPTSTQVAGLRAWQQDHGRQVRRGEKAIWIFAPITRKVTEVDESGQEASSRRVVGFKPVPVFDVAQTDGEVLPQAPATVMAHAVGDAPVGMVAGLLGAIGALGYRVEFRELGGSDGATDGAAEVVYVESSLSGLEQAKTLAHEAAHIVLGHTSRTDYHTGPGGGRPDMEVEAESVAYVISRHHGMTEAAAGVSTFGYVDGWAHGDLSRLRRSADRVVVGCRELLELLLGL